MMKSEEIEREVVKALKKHLRDGHLAAALEWLKARTELFNEWEKLG